MYMIFFPMFKAISIVFQALLLVFVAIWKVFILAVSHPVIALLKIAAAATVFSCARWLWQRKREAPILPLHRQAAYPRWGPSNVTNGQASESRASQGRVGTPAARVPPIARSSPWNSYGATDEGSRTNLPARHWAQPKPAAQLPVLRPDPITRLSNGDTPARSTPPLDQHLGGPSSVFPTSSVKTDRQADRRQQQATTSQYAEHLEARPHAGVRHSNDFRDRPRESGSAVICEATCQGVAEGISTPKENEAEPSNSRYTLLRAPANAAGDAMARAFEDSHAAYADGDGARAKKLSRLGKAKQAEMDRLNEEASACIFRQNNANRKLGEVDLHGLYVVEALKYADQSIVEAQQREDSKIRLIVGKGLHSRAGEAKIKPAVEDHVKDEPLSQSSIQATQGCWSSS